jgi:hypothetical protein
VVNTVHVHATWLFLDCIFPADKSDGPDQPERDFRLPPTIAAPGFALGHLDDSGYFAPVSAEFYVTGHALVDGHAASGRDRSCQSGPLSGPLCDAARRARSGVLVI